MYERYDANGSVDQSTFMCFSTSARKAGISCAVYPSPSTTRLNRLSAGPVVCTGTTVAPSVTRGSACAVTVVVPSANAVRTAPAVASSAARRPEEPAEVMVMQRTTDINAA